MELFVMNPDASGQRRLMRVAGRGDGNPVWSYDGRAAWSPDGRKIAFVSRERDNPGARSDIHVTDVDGSGQVNLTPEKPTSG